MHSLASYKKSVWIRSYSDVLYTSDEYSRLLHSSLF